MAHAASFSFRTVVLFKPFDVLSQFTAEIPGQRTLSEFGLPPGLYPAGRLDRDSEGLLLLSNDGRFIERLLNPEAAHPRVYLAQVEGLPSEEALERLRLGVEIRTGGKLCRTRPAQAERLAEEPLAPPRHPPIRFRAAVPTAWISLCLTEGKNRQVRKMTAAVGHPTLRLIRTAVGAAALTDLAPGEWRDIDAAKVLTPSPPSVTP